MKKNLFLLLLLVMCGSYQVKAATTPAPSLYQKLVEVNACWQKHPEAAPATGTALADERAMIKLHLQLVEQALRKTDVTHLSKKQKQARLQHLDHLHQYWQQGAFPINTSHSYRLPIFIDPFDNFCAVGYLIKASGHEELSRYISASTNFAYLADMQYPELNKWAAASGLSHEELAWIQPGYSPAPNYIQPMLGGTNGVVKAMAINPASNEVFAAGDFSQLDGMPNAGNVGKYGLGFAGPFWAKLSNGLTGEVEAMVVHNGEVYAGGSNLHVNQLGVIYNVVKWNGSEWTPTAPVQAPEPENSLHLLLVRTFCSTTNQRRKLCAAICTNPEPAHQLQQIAAVRYFVIT